MPGGIHSERRAVRVPISFAEATVSYIRRYAQAIDETSFHVVYQHIRSAIAFAFVLTGELPRDRVSISTSEEVVSYKLDE
jgi:hypothetical protein